MHEMNFFDALRQFGIDACVEHLAYRHRINQERDRVFGHSGPREAPRCDPVVQPRGARSCPPSPNLGDLLQDVALLGLYNMRELTRLHTRYADFLIDAVYGRFGSRRASPSHPEPGLLLLRGQADGMAEACFLVVNAHEQAAIVSFSVSELREAGTGRALQKQLSFDPESPRMSPGQEVVVRVRVALDKDFRAGGRYVGHVDAVMNATIVRSFVLYIEVEPERQER